MLRQYYDSRLFNVLFLGLLTCFWALICAKTCFSEELTIQVQWLSPEGTSPYLPQLLVQLTNEGFVSFPLTDQLQSSVLVVDGHPYKRSGLPLGGPPGLPAKGSWEGCMALNDFSPEGIRPGSHHIQLRIGNAVSKDVHAKMPKTAPPAVTPPERLKQVENLKNVIAPGLLRPCVEYWLTERDGGLATMDGIRYYVDPEVKVLVRYDHSLPEPRVKGSVRVYRENRVAD